MVNRLLIFSNLKKWDIFLKCCGLHRIFEPNRNFDMKIAWTKTLILNEIYPTVACKSQDWVLVWKAVICRYQSKLKSLQSTKLLTWQISLKIPPWNL